MLENKKPFRVNVNIHGACNRKEAEENAAYSKSLSLPQLLDYPTTLEKLAVVGSSPNINFKTLKNWDGDIWAINGTSKLLYKHNIPHTMISIDPFNYDCTGLFEDIFRGVEKAILATHCSPLMFDFLKNKDVKTFNALPTEENYITGGTTTATRAPTLALLNGFKEISFFGLEGCFKTISHFYKDEVPDWHKLIIRTGKIDYLTCVELMMQSHNLAAFIKTFPHIFKDCSGAMLRGMVDHFDTWEVVGMSQTIKSNQVKENAA